MMTARCSGGGLDALVEHRRLVGETPAAELGQAFRRDDPAVRVSLGLVRGAVERDDAARSGSSSRWSRSFWTWAAFSANTTRLPESATMKATSASSMVG